MSDIKVFFSNLFGDNSVRSDIIIGVLSLFMFIMYVYFGLDGEVLGSTIRWAMMLIAVEYVGTEAIDVFTKK